MSAFSDPPRRYLHLWLDRLSIDRTRRSQPSLGAPLALIAKQANAVRLQALDAGALAAGLRVGMTLSDARAQVPELKTAEADEAADRACLRRVAELCRRYTPSLSVDPPDGVNLNITGAQALFGGEAALADDLVGRLARVGFHACYGVADTPGLAWALARHGRDPIAGTGQGRAVLSALPMAALRLEPQTLEMLRALGLRRVGQVLEPRARAGLARRLGEALLTRIDEAVGDRACALTLKLEVSPWSASMRLADPAVLDSQVLEIVRGLAARLAERLEGEAKGGRLFVLELHRVDGAVRRLAVAASRPLRDPRRIAALFAERVAALNEGLEADYGFDLLRLWVRRAEAFDARPGDLLDAGAGEAGFAALIDRLSARMGEGTVRRQVPVPQTRVPEKAVRGAAFDVAGAPAWTHEPVAADQGAPLRPVTLFTPPQPIDVTAVVPEGAPDQFKWRRLARRIVAAEGPERLEPEWGRITELPRVRDYYRLEDQEGRRYWVFREGRYGQGDDPRWFIHGLLP